MLQNIHKGTFVHITYRTQSQLFFKDTQEGTIELYDS
jgi:hypothetical protein